MCTSVTPTNNFLSHQDCCTSCSCNPYSFIYNCSSLTLDKSRTTASPCSSKIPMMNTPSSAAVCKSEKPCCGCSSNETNSNGSKTLNVPILKNDSSNTHSTTSLPPNSTNSTSKQSSQHHCNKPCCSSKQESPSSSQQTNSSLSTNLLTLPTQNPNSYSTVTSPSYHHAFTQSHLHSEERIESSDLNETKPVDETSNQAASEATSNYFKIVFGSSINEPACGTSKSGSCECSGCNYSVGQSNRGAAIVAIQAHLPPTPRGSSNTSKRGGGCKGSSAGSVKIQKKSVMQNKLKNQLSRMRDSGVPALDDSDATMNESDRVNDDSGIIVSTN